MPILDRKGEYSARTEILFLEEQLRKIKANERPATIPGLRAYCRAIVDKMREYPGMPAHSYEQICTRARAILADLKDIETQRQQGRR